MKDMSQWETALAEAICEALDAVDGGSPHDADAWIALEERLGSDAVKELWSHPALGRIARALDHFCHTAQHDRDVVFDEVSLSDLRSLLVECEALLRQHSSDLPEALDVF